ncbi:hypothetical protein AB0M47_36635 [Hamadaea sp. NPDC051192]|uniref:hypothetical protein n=1 Tax=Hamadaea sp. NPDC051192 TaxID=3154940 RepID=UPI0034168F81
MSVQHTMSEDTQGDDDSRVPDKGAGGSLTRVTANFTPRAMKAIDRISTKTGDSKTDILNKSVMMYEAFLELLERSDSETLTVKLKDREVDLWLF